MKGNIVMMVIGCALMLPMALAWLSAYCVMTADMLRAKDDWLIVLGLWLMTAVGALLFWYGYRSLQVAP